jgi:hypothetical protein
MTAMWVQGLDAAPADKAPKLYSKKGLASLRGWRAGDAEDDHGFSSMNERSHESSFTPF